MAESFQFGEADRARLWFKVADLLPTTPDTYERLSQRGMFWLEDALKRVLGRLSLAKGYTEKTRIESYRWLGMLLMGNTIRGYTSGKTLDTLSNNKRVTN